MANSTALPDGPVNQPSNTTNGPPMKRVHHIFAAPHPYDSHISKHISIYTEDNTSFLESHKWQHYNRAKIARKIQRHAHLQTPYIRILTQIHAPEVEVDEEAVRVKRPRVLGQVTPVSEEVREIMGRYAGYGPLILTLSVQKASEDELGVGRVVQLIEDVPEQASTEANEMVVGGSIHVNQDEASDELEHLTIIVDEIVHDSAQCEKDSSPAQDTTPVHAPETRLWKPTPVTEDGLLAFPFRLKVSTTEPMIASSLSDLMHNLIALPFRHKISIDGRIFILPFRPVPATMTGGSHNDDMSAQDSSEMHSQHGQSLEDVPEALEYLAELFALRDHTDVSISNASPSTMAFELVMPDPLPCCSSRIHELSKTQGNDLCDDLGSETISLADESIDGLTITVSPKHLVAREDELQGLEYLQVLFMLENSSDALDDKVDGDEIFESSDEDVRSTDENESGDIHQYEPYGSNHEPPHHDVSDLEGGSKVMDANETKPESSLKSAYGPASQKLLIAIHDWHRKFNKIVAARLTDDIAVHNTDETDGLVAPVLVLSQCDKVGDCENTLLEALPQPIEVGAQHFSGDTTNTTTTSLPRLPPLCNSPKDDSMLAEETASTGLDDNTATNVSSNQVEDTFVSTPRRAVNDDSFAMRGREIDPRPPVQSSEYSSADTNMASNSSNTFPADSAPFSDRPQTFCTNRQAHAFEIPCHVVPSSTYDQPEQIAPAADPTEAVPRADDYEADNESAGDADIRDDADFFFASLAAAADTEPLLSQDSEAGYVAVQKPRYDDNGSDIRRNEMGNELIEIDGLGDVEIDSDTAEWILSHDPEFSDGEIDQNEESPVNNEHEHETEHDEDAQFKTQMETDNDVDINTSGLKVLSIQSDSDDHANTDHETHEGVDIETSGLNVLSGLSNSSTRTKTNHETTSKYMQLWSGKLEHDTSRNIRTGRMGNLISTELSDGSDFEEIDATVPTPEAAEAKRARVTRQGSKGLGSAKVPPNENLLEAKNGDRGDKKPRERKGFARRVKNWWGGKSWFGDSEKDEDEQDA